MTDYWLPDNTVTCNFAIIDRLDLLKTFLSDRGRVVEAVAQEIRNSAEVVPHLARLDLQEWFGDPIRVVKDADIRAVDNIRIGVFGGTGREPLRHLGESQTIYVIRSRSEFRNSVWITDDEQAFRYAKQQGIQTWKTVDIFSALVANGELESTTAFELCVAIEAERNLLDPPTSAKDFA